MLGKLNITKNGKPNRNIPFSVRVLHSLSVTQPQSLCFENRPESRLRENWTRCCNVDVICRGKRKKRFGIRLLNFMLENKINRRISIKSISNFVRSCISVCITATQNPRLRDKISRLSCVAAGPKSMSIVVTDASEGESS